MHIDAKYCLLEHFEKSVKRIILHYYSSESRNQPSIIAHKSRVGIVNLSRSKCSN